VCGTSKMSQGCRATKRTSLARARRGRELVAGLIVLLCLAGVGYMVDPGAIAQEVVRHYHWRVALDPNVLTVEQEKANAE
jgi:hypothetical protein